MASVKRYNESSDGAIVSDGVVVFPGVIDEEEDILFECSCICLSSITTSGTIRAQYDFRTESNIECKELNVGGNFYCAGDVTADLISVGKGLIADGTVRADHIQVTESMLCSELGCVDLVVGDKVIVRNSADIVGNVQVDKYLICLDGITADGEVKNGRIIAGDYADINGKAVILSEFDSIEAFAASIAENEKEPINIAEEPVLKLEDYDSPLATVMNDVSVFIENFQESFATKDLNTQIKELKLLSGFLPSFEDIYHGISRVKETSDANKSKDWYSDFIELSKIYVAMPEWMRKSQVERFIAQKLSDYLHYFATNNVKNRSRSKWGLCLNAFIQLQKCKGIDSGILREIENCIPILYKKIGIKSPLVTIYLPEE